MSIQEFFNEIDTIFDNPLFLEYGLWGLFINGVFSPILPIPPELTSSALILAGESKISVAIVLSVGWILSAFFGYYLGLSGNKIIKNKIVKDSREKMDKTEITNKKAGLLSKYQLFGKYGWIAILISPWIPILGDIITIIAGIKRYDFKKYIIAISIGKIIKSIVVVYLNFIILPLIFN